MPPAERLIDKKLRLTEQEIADVERLRGDRGQNVCFRRAIQQWIVRETALQEATMLGLYANGPIPVQPVAPPRPQPGDSVFSQPARKAPKPPALTQVEDPPEEDEVQEPVRRRPPNSAETWGSSEPPDAS